MLKDDSTFIQELFARLKTPTTSAESRKNLVTTEARLLSLIVFRWHLPVNATMQIPILNICFVLQLSRSGLVWCWYFVFLIFCFLVSAGLGIFTIFLVRNLFLVIRGSLESNIIVNIFVKFDIIRVKLLLYCLAEPIPYKEEASQPVD